MKDKTYNGFLWPCENGKPRIWSRVSHITPVFELSLVLLTTQALGLYEFTKKFQRYRPKIDVWGKIFVLHFLQGKKGQIKPENPQN